MSGKASSSGSAEHLLIGSNTPKFDISSSFETLGFRTFLPNHAIRSMSALGQKQTFRDYSPNVRSYPESGHYWRGRLISANDPKRTLTGVRRRYVWRNIFKIDEAQFMIAAGRIALYASHL